MTNKLELTHQQIDYLLSPAAIRERAAKIFTLTREGKAHFQFHPEKQEATVDYVLSVIRKNYPDLNIPFHSRWGHFRVGGVDRAKQFDQSLNGDAMEGHRRGYVSRCERDDVRFHGWCGRHPAATHHRGRHHLHRHPAEDRQYEVPPSVAEATPLPVVVSAA